MMMMTQVGYLESINPWTNGEETLDQSTDVLETGGAGASNFTASVEGAELIIDEAMTNITFQYNASAANGSTTTTNGNGTTWRVTDINSGSSNSNPGQYMQILVGDTIYFDASDPGSSGVELWAHDTSNASTWQVADLASGSSSSNPGEYMAILVGDTLYFSANDGSSGHELWAHDTSNASTWRVADIRSGTDGSNPGQYMEILVGDTLYFSAQTGFGNSGTELWAHDTSNASTWQVADINSGSGSSSPGAYMAILVGDTLYFNANDGSSGNELWAHDTSNVSTWRVADINSGISNSYPGQYMDAILVGDTLYFDAYDANSGAELWAHDTSNASTWQAADIRSGLYSSSIGQYMVILAGDTLYLGANDGNSGTELWAHDTSNASTWRVAALNSGAESSFPGAHMSTLVGNTLYFDANDGTSGIELWAHDISNSSTWRVADIRGGTASSIYAPYMEILVGDTLYFSAEGPNDGYELWAHDTSNASTWQVADIYSGISDSNPGMHMQFLVGDTLYFDAYDASSGYELWAHQPAEITTLSNGSGTTTNGNGTTWEVADIFSGGSHSNPGQYMEILVGDTLYFDATDGSSGKELWAHDTSNASTWQVADIRSGPVSSIPGQFILELVGDTLYFSADDGSSGKELWAHDTSNASTWQVADLASGSSSSSPGQYMEILVGDTLYFDATGSSGGHELWAHDTSNASTWQVADILSGSAGSSPGQEGMAILVGDTLYFCANGGSGSGRELWAHDTSNASTWQVAEINSVGWNSNSNPGQYMSMLVGDTFYFSADDGSSGYELWAHDTSNSSTWQVANIRSGTDGSWPGQHMELLVGDTLYFDANDGISGYELWAHDTSNASTWRVTDINSGSSNSNPGNNMEILVGDTIYFSAQTGFGNSGYELWAHDTSNVSTWEVADIYSGGSSSIPGQYMETLVGDTLYFSANDGSSGHEVWAHDTSNASTWRVADIKSGSGSSSPGGYMAILVGDTLYFDAYDANSGTELRAHQPGEITSLSSGSGSGSSGGMTNVTGATSCVASPSLPNGLNIDSSTCTISGTPSVETSNTTYTVTAVISGTTYQTTVWLSSAYQQLTPSVEGVDLETGEVMTDITFNAPLPPANGTIETIFEGGTNARIQDLEADIDSNDVIHAVFFDPDSLSLIYANDASGTWSSEVLATGESQYDPSIVIDSNDKIHISYLNFTNKEVMYTNNVAGSWATSVASDFLRFWGYNYHCGTSIDVDSNNNAYIAYVYDCGRSTAKLEIADNSGGSWSSTTLQQTYSGYHLSSTSFDLILDSDDAAHVLYTMRNLQNNRLNHTTNEGGSWVSTQIGSTVFGSYGMRYVSVNIDSTDVVHSVHQSNSDLIYSNNSGGTWTSTSSSTFPCSVGSTSGTHSCGALSSIFIDTDDNTHISHQFMDHRHLLYVNNVSGSWQTTQYNNPGSTGSTGYGYETALVVDSNGDVEILHGFELSGQMTLVSLYQQGPDSGSGSGSGSGVEYSSPITSATSCVASPSLPTGLNIDSGTCTISGTPTVDSVNTTYTISAVINGITYEADIWLSTFTFGTITSAVEGAALNLGEAMTPISLNYTSQAPAGSFYSGNGSTWMVKDINPSTSTSGGNYVQLRSGFDVGSILITMGDFAYFGGNNGTVSGLWKSDGTASGTVMVKENLTPRMPVTDGEKIFFKNGSSGNLWVTDGTTSGTFEVSVQTPKSSVPMTMVNGLVFFGVDDANGTELWVSDGTSAGTQMVKDIAPGYPNTHTWNPYDGLAGTQLLTMGNHVYFFGNDQVHGKELWKSDGTASGTVMVKDIWNGSAPGGVFLGEVAGNTLFFEANNGSSGNELWKTDGTTTGTVMVKDIYSATITGTTIGYGSDPERFTLFGDEMFFTANDGIHGRELWKSDGTTTGTVMVKDITPYNNVNGYAMNTVFTSLSATSEFLYFAVDVPYQPNSGPDFSAVYVSDGTSGGTFAVENQTQSVDHFLGLTPLGDQVYFFNRGTSQSPIYNLYVTNGTASGTNPITSFTSNGQGHTMGIRPVITGNTVLYPSCVNGSVPQCKEGIELMAYAPVNITLNAPPPVSWETDPALPAGMSISGGTISGTPSVYATNQTYTIYANQSGNSTTHELYFSVDTTNAHTVVENQTIDAIGFHPPFWNGTTAWTVSPALPGNLSMDTSTGEITGMVNTTMTNTSYTVTATHSGSGAATETFMLNLQSLADYDGDGLPNDLPSDYNAAEGPTPGLVADDDDDGDGLADSIETDTGTYIDGTNTGTDPLNPDTDGDGICDGPNAVAGVCVAGPDSDPIGAGQPATLVAVNNTAISTLAPYKSVSGGTYEIAPDLPASLSLNPATGEITGTATETITNTTYTMWSNNSNGDSVSWNFTIEILEDSDGDGLPNELPDDYDTSNPDAPGLVEDTDDDGDGTPDSEEDGDGTDPTNPDTDGDGMCDGPNAVDPICVAGPDAFPLDPSGDTDTDGDGKPDTLNPPSNSIPPLEEDLDDDGDGIEDVNETNTGIDNGPTDKGTDPLNPDTDGDGICDGPIDVYDPLGNLICVAGPDETPFGEDASGMVYGLNNTQFSSLVPPYQLPNAVWEIAPDLPLGLSIDPVSGIISGTPAEIMENTTFTIYGNATSSSITFDFNLQILEDTDRDGMPNTLPEDYPVDGELIEDLDDDGDGASDLSETGTGIYNGTGDMGTDPLDPDTDDDGICDGPNDVLPQCIGGPDSNPFGTGPLGPTVLVNNSMTAPILPANAVPGATWEVSPALPDGLVLDPATGIITGTPTQTMDNTTFTMWANTTTPSMSILSTFWLEVLEDSDGDGMPDELPDDYPDTNPPYDLIEDLDDDNDGMSDEDETILGTDPTNPDTDGDGFCDGNGTGDGDCYAGPDSSPLDPTQPVNTDGDAYPDEDPDGEGGLTADDDDDNDGYLDTREIDCLSDPLNATDMPQDLDMDGICDALDDDIDGDGLFNVIETNTGIYNSSIDTGSDPRNADTDGDGVCDGPTSPVTSNCTAGPDAFPLDPAAHADTDGDGMPDELFGNSTSTPPLVLDLDDDNDDWSDVDETACGTDHLDDTSTPVDTDSDGLCDALDDLLDLPFTLTYSSETLLLNVDEEMTAFMPNISGLGEVATWEISGELPEGLTFGWSPARDALLDGSIRGTPTEEMEMTNFTIWANNSAHSQSFDFSLTIIEEVVDEDDDDDGFGWMWCFPCLIILLLLLLIPLLFGSDKILLMLADGPEPENTTSSPAFLSGAGTQEDPFVLEPITGLQPGESASSVEVITIDKMSDIQVEMIDLNQDSNGDKFSMYEPEFGDAGTRLIGIGKDGEIIIHMKFDDGIDTPTFEGGEYSGLLKLGRASVYFSWSVTVKKNMSKKKKYEKELAKELEESNDAEESDSEGDEPEGAVDVVKDKIHSTLDRDGDGELSLEDVKAGASQVGESVKKGAGNIKKTVVIVKEKAHEFLDKDGDGKLTKEDLKIITGRTDEKVAAAKAAKEAKAAKKKAKKEAAAAKKEEEALARKQAEIEAAREAEEKAAQEAEEKAAAEAKAREEADAKAFEISKAKVAAEEKKIEQEKLDLEKAAEAARQKSANVEAKVAKQAKEKAAAEAKAAKDAKAKEEAEAKAAKEKAAAAKKKAEKKPVAKEVKKQEELKRVKSRAETIDFKTLGKATSSTLKSEVKKGAATLEVANAKEFAQAGTAAISDDSGRTIITWTGKDGNTLTGVKGITRIFGAASIVMVKDDLQVIKGIGPFIEEKLNALGITTYRQIANMDAKLETQVNEAIEFFPGRVKRDQWANQAKILLGEDVKLDEKALKQAEDLERISKNAESIDFATLGVATLDEKDDLQTIKGIGPFIAEKLYALGIYTFEQVGNMNSEIEEQVNKAIEFFPGRVKRDQWAKQAKTLHDEKK